jgi:alcohol dehydrogenase (cytochrome c)
MNLGSSVTGYPVTFEAGGHQYVAVSTGFWLGDSFTPELIKGGQGTLFVFALPDAGIGRRGPPKAPVNPTGGAIPVDPAQAGASTRKASDGVYTAAQAAQGRTVYAEHCAACHGATFNPAQGVPPLTGPAFAANWKGHSLAELYAKVKTMPPGSGGSLSDADYRAATAYLLQANGYKPGQPLPDDEALLRAIGMAD